MRNIVKTTFLTAAIGSTPLLYAQGALADPKPQSRAQIQSAPKGSTTFNVKLKGYVFGLRVMRANISGTAGH